MPDAPSYPIILSEARFLLGRERHDMASGRISCVLLNFALSLLSDSGDVAWCSGVKSHGLPQGDHTRPTHSMVQLDCAHLVNQYLCVQK
jgi:hypothetical protein